MIAPLESLHGCEALRVLSKMGALRSSAREILAAMRVLYSSMRASFSIVVLLFSKSVLLLIVSIDRRVAASASAGIRIRSRKIIRLTSVGSSLRRSAPRPTASNDAVMVLQNWSISAGEAFSRGYSGQAVLPLSAGSASAARANWSKIGSGDDMSVRRGCHARPPLSKCAYTSVAQPASATKGRVRERGLWIQPLVNTWTTTSPTRAQRTHLRVCSY